LRSPNCKPDWDKFHPYHMSRRDFDFQQLINNGRFGAVSTNFQMKEDEMHSEFDSHDDSTNFNWVNYFLSKSGNSFFCRVDESYINDSFNLYGMIQQVPYYDAALDLICDIDEDEEYSEEHQELIENDADVLYGLIHARFIVTNRGLQAMFEKYKNREFGECPYVYCNNKPLLPCGLTNEKKQRRRKAVLPLLRKHLPATVEPARKHRRRFFWNYLLPPIFSDISTTKA